MAGGLSDTSRSEITILARLLGKHEDQLPPVIARYILSLGFSDEDKTRMHDLAIRNQAGDLRVADKEEMLAYAKAGTLLAILKSKARRALRIKPKKRATA